jgi:hypothetical protein
MPFKLIVEFSGPCLYVIDTPSADGKFADRLGVVMPDCRLPPDEVKPKHLDDDPAEPHVGYLRIDLGDVDPKMFPRGEEQNPLYELVHRFDQQILRFVEVPLEDNEAGGEGQTEDEEVDERINVSGLAVPSFDLAAPELVLEDNLFKEDASILMRTVLEGGAVTPGTLTEWKFVYGLNPNSKKYEGKFASSLKWTREFNGSGLIVEITSLKGVPEVKIPLIVEDGREVHMRVANLCAFNPLEWPELETPETPNVDADFKWLYHLFQNVPMRIPALPVPKFVKSAGGETGDNGCMGATKLGSTG